MATIGRLRLTERQCSTLRSLTELIIVAIEFLGSGGLVTVDDLVPGIRQFLRTGKRKWDPWKVPRAIKRAERRGFVSVRDVGEGEPALVQLTERGRTLLARRLLEGCAVERPHRWDGRWRVLVFDVPEKKRRERDVLRAMLRRLGFRYLQRSVWVYPFDCAETVRLLRAVHKLSHIIVRSITAIEIEDDRALRRHFNL